MRKLGIACLVGICAALLLYAGGLAPLAGAHPDWSLQLLTSAGLLGPLLGTLLLQKDHVKRTLGLSFLVIAAFAAADYGRSQFVASFGEDEIAGQMWFIGWHILGISLVAHVVTAVYYAMTGPLR